MWEAVPHTQKRLKIHPPLKNYLLDRKENFPIGHFPQNPTPPAPVLPPSIGMGYLWSLFCAIATPVHPMGGGYFFLALEALLQKFAPRLDSENFRLVGLFGLTSKCCPGFDLDLSELKASKATL